MKTKRTWLPLALMFVAMLAGYVRCDVCKCETHNKGCTISTAASAGFKCRCGLTWKLCKGSDFPCVGNEQCPGNQADYCACKLAKGNCAGYVNPETACGSPVIAKKGVLSSGDCECQLQVNSPRGCTISKPAPYGWKCVCINKKFLFRSYGCVGWAQACAVNEICPGDDYSYCGCKQGGGDCSGYPDKLKSCPSHKISTSCNCNRAADWSIGLYTTGEVKYDFNHKTVSSMKPIFSEGIHIKDTVGGTPSSSFTMEEKVAHTSSFSQTEGIKIEAGETFEAGIPIIGKAISSFILSASSERKYGISETVRRNFKEVFHCQGIAYKDILCTVSLLMGELSVPFTMMLNHRIIPNCACETSGVWKTSYYYSSDVTSEVVH